MSSNLLKGFYINNNDSASTEKYIIDTNELAKKRLELIAESLRKETKESSSGGFVQGLNAETVELLLTDEESEEPAVIKAQPKNPEDLLSEARAEAEAIIANANARAESILSEAKRQAQQSLIQSVEEGKKQGYREGTSKAMAELDKMKEELKDKEAQLDVQYQKQLNMMEPELVDVITGIYEHIFHVELRSYREILTHLIATTMRKIDGSRDFIIHVAKEDYPFVSMQKKQLAAGVASSSSNVEVVEDMTLSRNQCMIETEGGIFDCGLGTQMHELRQRLQLLSYQK
ncbi:MAG: hypothetical protein IJZ82_01700 [Lachnospiraceae bacterium]|nr:hypothetical protein [Lachnospiraceae bacterium]